jgi:hypothetical protein
MDYILYDNQYGNHKLTADKIFYVDPTNGNDSNDGLTPKTALKNPSAVDSKLISSVSTLLVAFVPGIHTFAPTDVTWFYVTQFSSMLYFVANPRNTKLIMDVTDSVYSNTGTLGTQRCHLFKSKTGSTSTMYTYLIGLNIESFGKTHGVLDGYQNYYNSSYKFMHYSASSCRIYASAGDASGTLAFLTNINSGSAILGSTFKNTTGTSITTYGINSNAQGYPISYSAFLNPLSGNGAPSLSNSKQDASIIDNNGHLSLNDENIDTQYGVYSSLPYSSWHKFSSGRSNYFLKSLNKYYVIRDSDSTLEETTELIAEEGLEPGISPADMSLIHTLTDPVLVGVETDTLAYNAVMLDDIQLMIPTGDIDMSLAYSILNFVFTDTGDVKRLLSVDSGVTWLYWDGSTFTAYEDDITDKAAVYAAANDTDTLNDLTAEQIAEILPVDNAAKKIRFLTVLRQETLADTAKTQSVGINNERWGHFESIPVSQFEERVYSGTLQIKYIGADNIDELHLLLADL